MADRAVDRLLLPHRSEKCEAVWMSEADLAPRDDSLGEKKSTRRLPGASLWSAPKSRGDVLRQRPSVTLGVSDASGE
jgi:hypothetical protein